MNKQDSVNVFLKNFDFMVKSLLGISLKYFIFRNTTDPTLVCMVLAFYVPILRPLAFYAQLY